MGFLYALEAIRNPVLDKIMYFFTVLGQETVFLVLAIAVFWCVNKRQGYYMMTVGFVGIILNQALKLIFRIPRPWVKDPNFTIVESARNGATGYSFPSGHTQNAVNVFGTTAGWTDKKWLRWVCIGLIVLISFSRMYLGVHTPADVITALVMGVVLTMAFYPFFKNDNGDPKKMLRLIGIMLIVAVAYVLFVELYKFPVDIDPDNLHEGIMNGYKLMGAVAGLLIAYIIDEKHTRFETSAPLWVQAVKLVVGFGLLMAVKEGLKAPLSALFSESVAACVRYFAIVLFAGAVWPLSFKPLSNLANKSK